MSKYTKIVNKEKAQVRKMPKSVVPSVILTKIVRQREENMHRMIKHQCKLEKMGKLALPKVS